MVISQVIDLFSVIFSSSTIIKTNFGMFIAFHTYDRSTSIINGFDQTNPYIPAYFEYSDFAILSSDVPFTVARPSLNTVSSYPDILKVIA